MKLEYVIYYDRSSRCWWAYWSDRRGNQVGAAIHAHNRDQCLVELGSVQQDREEQHAKEQQQ